jgi:hypothetical protein
VIKSERPGLRGVVVPWAFVFIVPIIMLIEGAAGLIGAWALQRGLTAARVDREADHLAFAIAALALLAAPLACSIGAGS